MDRASATLFALLFVIFFTVIIAVLQHLVVPEEDEAEERLPVTLSPVKPKQPHSPLKPKPPISSFKKFYFIANGNLGCYIEN